MKLSEKAVIVRLQLKGWAAKKSDKVVSLAISDKYNTSANAGIYIKNLLKRSALQQVNQVMSDTGIFHKDNTLPWLDGNQRLLPINKFFEYGEGIRENRGRLKTALDEFAKDWPKHIENAKSQLGDTFDENDYPSDPQDITSRFDINLERIPVPDNRDWRVNMTKDELTTVRAELEESLNNVNRGILVDLWARMHSTIEVLNKRLDSGVLREAVFANVIKMANSVDSLNIIDDKDLSDMADKARKLVKSHDHDSFRNDKEVRESATKETGGMLTDINTSMDAYMGKS